MTIFDSKREEKVESFFIDERLNPSDLLFVVYILADKLTKITLTENLPLASFEKYEFGVVNEKLYLNGPMDIGFQEIEGQDFLVLSRENAQTKFFIFNDDIDLVISSDDFAGIQTPSTSRIVLHGQHLILDVKDEMLYHNDEKVSGHQVFPLVEGSSVLTPYFVLEKRAKQYKLTIFSDGIDFDPNQILLQEREAEFPKDFPDYRRSPRLNLEVPKDSFHLQGIDQDQNNKRDGLLKTVLPPLGMVAMTGVMTYVSGQNLVMLLVMGGASIMTTAFTVTQYLEDKKIAKLEAIKAKEDYEFYLVSEVGKLTPVYRRENDILHFQQPRPKQLVALTTNYDSRIYERQVHNKDFLTISLGLSDRPSNLKIETDVDAKNLSANAEHLRSIHKQFATQRQVPTPISLLEQTLGLVGTQEVLATTLENLLFQTAFFHSYREVNFISVLPRKSYEDSWRKWRLLPHFKLQELNMRGLIYNEKIRDVVLNSFLQILNKRKQVVNEAGREKVQFSPHYIFTIVDDGLLSGHGINERLAEDMSELGVTVIWCKEDANQLPETVVSVVEVPSTTNGKLLSDHGIYLDKDFIPYPELPDLETSLRKLANLNYLEVEKNAVPESLSLLEQYEVQTIEELEISERWAKAEPNKSIKSLIGWRGKSDYAYWDLHERGHGPHALVGGTTGSGKSEFLTTYLIGLAINFSPEDIGMLIIDWKGGGIANTLDKLPHFMGAITNLDGAGTARALASIKAELDKRQREFAKFGVNSINDYMSLYKQRHTPKPDVKYPTKPLPHLILVSDEFAELKANVPEFLDELTSVARIGRSLGVHLILATQKPSGVVNDQIEANSKSKIALKMAGVEDSNELLKTPDAAHITNPGRGYLKVGENEVYELFQSGYAGVPYDPEATTEEKIDERLFRINGLGQYELMYDPTEEVVQGKDTSDLPSQLEAVITAVGEIFGSQNYHLPDKPWLPNLSEAIATPIQKLEQKRTLKIPLGLLDIPSKQAQEVYEFDLEKQGHTAIFASAGYGKSTVLQTLAMNLARVNTPEQVQFNLLDFGTNGLLPLKDLPHVADIVTLEEPEKLGKMLASILEVLAVRKKLFKEVGVATLAQYETKTKKKLPILLNLLDSYDGVDPDDDFKDVLDSMLMQLLRDGAGLGVYLILTAGREGAIRMNMMSSISTKMALFLNDESDVEALMGREKLLQVAVRGRGQVMVEVPTAIQFYLPVACENSTEMLNHLEQEVATLDKAWTGERPVKIPMVAENLSFEAFENYITDKVENTLYLGMSRSFATVTSFKLFEGNSLGIFTESNKQASLLLSRVMSQLTNLSDNREIIIIDILGTLKEWSSVSTIYLNRSRVNQESLDLKTSILALLSEELKAGAILIIVNGLAELVETLMLDVDELENLLAINNDRLQFIFLDSVANVGSDIGGITAMVKGNVYQILFGGSLEDQNFEDNLSYEQKRGKVPRNILHTLKDEVFDDIVIPTEVVK